VYTLQLFTFSIDNIIFMNTAIVAMSETLQLVAYSLLGFGAAYLALETAWHYTACKIQGGTLLKPCLFKQVKMAMASSRK
jgi:hypothetical protein